MQYQQHPQYQQPPHCVANRDKTSATLLAIFLGGGGAHKFYLGQVGPGVVYLLFFWTFIPAVIGLIEGLVLAGMSKQDFDAKYNIWTPPHSPYR
ncbi:TM2 domain-containing protein [Enhygromyxa salina]|uniref:TM2 domain-containing protein n=1 Tax=Enhygromyxa salina TaxID=215803 RepID=UPI00069860D2|nr:TM2 domain-containing protein [Enhygromyxa salina]